MTKKELKEWMWQWLSPYADQYKFMDEFDAKLDEYVKTKVQNLDILSVSTSDSQIEELFPFEPLENASPTKPLERISRYNSAQEHRREGARRLIALIWNQFLRI